ncbi:major tail protein [Gordonia phage Margaret]|nr:major tail protein [Gordonia phage Margaret]
MANNNKNVFAAMPRATGALLHGELGAELPTSAKTDLSASPYVDVLKDLGFIGEDGFTQSESRDTDKKKAFGGTVVKVLQTDYSLTIQFAFLESTNADVLRAIYGDANVTIGTDEDPDEIVVRKNKMQSPHAAWVIDVIDGNSLNRTVIADGQITEVDDIVKVHTDTIMYTVTMECFEDANGDNLIEYFATAGGSAVLTITNGSVPAGEVGEPYSADFNAVGGSGDLVWSVSAGDLPAGLTLNASTGVLSGTPTTAGSSNFTVRAVDEQNNGTTRAYTLVVNA